MTPVTPTAHHSVRLPEQFARAVAHPCVVAVAAHTIEDSARSPWSIPAPAGFGRDPWSYNADLEAKMRTTLGMFPSRADTGTARLLSSIALIVEIEALAEEAAEPAV